MNKIIFSLFVLSIIGCAPKTTEVIQESSHDPKHPEKEMEQANRIPDEAKKKENVILDAFPSGEIAEGSTLFTANCAKCNSILF